MYNKFNGEGTLKHANGDVYTGDFKNNQKHGRGKYIFNSMKDYK